MKIKLDSILAIGKMRESYPHWPQYTNLNDLLSNLSVYHDSYGWVEIPDHEFISTMIKMGIHSGTVTDFRHAPEMDSAYFREDFTWVSTKEINFWALKHGEKIHVFIQFKDYFQEVFFKALSVGRQSGNLFDFILQSMPDHKFPEIISVIHQMLESKW